jgi:hypothetical protein
MEPSSPEEEFRRIQKEISDEDPVVRGIAAVDLGSLATENPEFKDQALALLEKCLNDPDEDMRMSAQNSIDMIQGKKIVEAEEGKQVISFGYLPEEYRTPEAGSKQSLLSCVCCMILITVIIVTIFIVL